MKHENGVVPSYVVVYSMPQNGAVAILINVSQYGQEVTKGRDNTKK